MKYSYNEMADNYRVCFISGCIYNDMLLRILHSRKDEMKAMFTCFSHVPIIKHVYALLLPLLWNFLQFSNEVEWDNVRRDVKDRCKGFCSTWFAHVIISRNIPFNSLHEIFSTRCQKTNRQNFHVAESKSTGEQFPRCKSSFIVAKRYGIDFSVHS